MKILKVVSDDGYGIYKLEDGKVYTWDFDEDGISGTLESEGSIYKVISDERDDDDNAISFTIE